MDGFLRNIGQDSKVFTSIFDYIKDLVFLVEACGSSFHYLYVNQSALNILNIKRKLVGKQIRYIFSEYVETLLLPKYEQVLSSQQFLELEINLMTASGEFIGEASLNPIMTKEGSCKYILVIIRDVTDRKHKERELQETKRSLERNQKKLSSLVENNSEAVFELDLHGNFINLNKVTLQLIGYEENEENKVIGKSFVTLLVDEYLEETTAHFKNAVVGIIEKEEYETWIKNRNGKEIHLYVKNIPITVDGSVVGVYGIAHDITDLKRAERELKQSEEKFRLITENAFDIIKLTNPSGMIEYVSPSNERIIGYPSSEFVGQRYTKFVHHDDVAILERKFESLKNGAESDTIEYRILHQQGYYLWLEATTTPIIEDGEIRQFVSIARDITERIRYREELANMAFYDYLTGLPNRRTFEDRLNMAIHQANRSKKRVAVMMIDGHNFKRINDTYGHDAGDAVIKEMAKRLKDCVRQTDTVARFGGDEMGIILTELDSKNFAEDIANRILHSFEEPLYFNDHELKLGAGIGIAFYPDDTTNEKMLVKYADEALYEVKKSNQCHYLFYSKTD